MSNAISKSITSNAQPVQGSCKDVFTQNGNVTPAHPSRFIQFALKNEFISRAGYHETEQWSGKVSMIYIPGFTDGNVFRAEDNSMNPTLVIGDHIVAVRSNKPQNLAPDAVVVLREEDRFIVKRTRAIGNQVLFVCDNPDYPNIDIKSVDEVWEVKYKLCSSLLKRHLDIEKRFAKLERKLLAIKLRMEMLLEKGSN